MKKNSIKINGIFKIILYLVLASSGLFLLMNKYQYLGILSFLALLFLAILFLFFKRKVTSYHSDLIGLLLIIYLYFILSYFITGQSLNNFLSYSFLRYDGNFFFAYIPFFALAIPYFNYREVSKIYINFLFITFSIFSMIGIYGYLSNNLIFSMFQVEIDRGVMFTALNNAHNATGSVFAVVSIILLAFFLRERKKIKIFYFFILILCLLGLLITKSRGSYIGFAAGAIIVFWFFYRSWRKFAITMSVIITISALTVFLTGIYKKIPSIFNLTEGTSGVRLELWEKAWYLFSQSPIFGVGFARYNDIGYGNIRLTGMPQIASFFIEPKFDFSFAHAHNSYLQFLAETGFIGLVLILLFWVLCYLRILKAYDFTKNEFSKKIFLSGLGIIAALFTMALTENYFSATTVMMCASVFISLSIGLFWQEKYEQNI